MDVLIYAIHLVYDWLCIPRNFLGYNISFWELIVYGLVTGILWFFVRQIYDIED